MKKSVINTFSQSHCFNISFASFYRLFRRNCYDPGKKDLGQMTFFIPHFSLHKLSTIKNVRLLQYLKQLIPRDKRIITFCAIQSRPSSNTLFRRGKKCLKTNIMVLHFYLHIKLFSTDGKKLNSVVIVKVCNVQLLEIQLQLPYFNQISAALKQPKSKKATPSPTPRNKRRTSMADANDDEKEMVKKKIFVVKILFCRELADSSFC